LGAATFIFRNRFPGNWHIGWLNTLTLGSTVALGVDHIASGEIVPYPPFLSAMSNPADAAVMLGEVVSVGIPMALALVAVWVAMVIVYEKLLAPVPSGAGAPVRAKF
jgi:hypothetical protein